MLMKTKIYCNWLKQVKSKKLIKMILKHSSKENWLNKRQKHISSSQKDLNTDNPELNLSLILQAPWLQMVHGNKLISKNSILTQRVLKLRMETFIFLWKQNNNSLKSLPRWVLKKCKLIDMLSHLSGTLMLFSNHKPILPEMPMIHFSLVNPRKLKFMIKNISKRLRMFMKKEDMEVWDMIMNGILKKLIRIF